MRQWPQAFLAIECFHAILVFQNKETSDNTYFALDNSGYHEKSHPITVYNIVNYFMLTICDPPFLNN